jgi:hypothetical protein
MPEFHPIRTHVFHRKQSLVEFILENLPADQVQDSMILAITSKIVTFVDEITPQELQIPFEQDLNVPFLLKDSR